MADTVGTTSTNGTSASRQQAPPVAALPLSAVAQQSDLVDPTTTLLGALNLLPSRKQLEDADGVSSAFRGPPESVSLIEAGATALSKWWAAGFGATLAGLWGAIGVWWKAQDSGVQTGVLWAAAGVSAALILGVAYMLGSDVRGRSAAMVATIEARARVAQVIVEQAANLYTPTPGSTRTRATSATTSVAADAIPLPQALMVDWVDEDAGHPRGGADEKGWLATLVHTRDDGTLEFLLSKENRHHWVPATDTRVPARQ